MSSEPWQVSSASVRSAFFKPSTLNRQPISGQSIRNRTHNQAALDAGRLRWNCRRGRRNCLTGDQRTGRGNGQDYRTPLLPCEIPYPRDSALRYDIGMTSVTPHARSEQRLRELGERISQRADFVSCCERLRSGAATSFDEVWGSACALLVGALHRHFPRIVLVTSDQKAQDDLYDDLSLTGRVGHVRGHDHVHLVRR